LTLNSCTYSKGITQTIEIIQNILDKYNIDNTSKTDVTKQIQLAIKKEGQVVLPKGVYLVNGTIKLIDSQSIHLENGAWIVRKEYNEEPIIWMLGTYCSFTGNGKNSVIEAKVSTPNGLIRLGHKDMTRSSKNVLHATIKDLRMKGKSYGGGVDKIVDKGIYMPNPQHKGMASYFHTIHNLLITNVDIGIHLHGFSNANSINNIVLEGVGNEKKDTGIWIEGAQENRISDVFHHHSTGVGSTIRVNDCTTAKRTYTSSFNRVENVVSEPDAGKGISSCLIFSSKGTRNYFSISENNINGNKLSENFTGGKNILQSSTTGKLFIKNSIVNQSTFIPSTSASANSLFVDSKDGKLKFKNSKGKIHAVTPSN